MKQRRVTKTKEITPLQARKELQEIRKLYGKDIIKAVWLPGATGFTATLTVNDYYDDIETVLEENKKLKKLYKAELRNTTYYNNLALKYKRALEIIKEKGIDILEFKYHKKAKTYNEHTKRTYVKYYTEEEFKILKEIFNETKV